MTSPHDPPTNDNPPPVSPERAATNLTISTSKQALLARAPTSIGETMQLASGALSRSMVEPQNIAEMTALAQIFASAGVVQMPKNASGTETRPAEAGEILAMILNGRDQNLTAMQSIRGQYRIGNRWGLYVKMLHAKVRSSPLCRELRPLYQGLDRAVWFAWRTGDEAGAEFEFTWDEAVNAGLATKNTYRAYPRRMMSARALGEALVLVWPDIAEGMGIAEELIEALDVETASGPPPTEAEIAARRKERDDWSKPRSTKEINDKPIPGLVPPDQDRAPTAPRREPTTAELHGEFMAAARAAGAKNKQAIEDAAIAACDTADLPKLTPEQREMVLRKIREPATRGAAAAVVDLLEASRAAQRPKGRTERADAERSPADPGDDDPFAGSREDDDVPM